MSFRRRVAALAALLVLVASVAAASVAFGGTRAGASPRPQLTVFAAASLTNVLPQIDRRERYSFGGSNALAAQIQQGLPADVFASANTSIPDQLYAQGLVTKPVDFTANKLAIVVGKGNPQRIRKPQDLERSGLRIVMAAAGVPVGDYTRTVLANLGLSNLVGRAVAQETDVREVLTQVTLGQADAGFVYLTDARAFKGQVGVIGIPRKAQPTVIYAAAAVKAGKHLKEAKAWIAQLNRRRAQRKLRAAGFLPLPR
jgi:molybdate transport system substrate-binding protein